MILQQRMQAIKDLNFLKNFTNWFYLKYLQFNFEFDYWNQALDYVDENENT